MPRISIFKLGQAQEPTPPAKLAGYTPSLLLSGLQLGVDNLRHDVYLSSKFVDNARHHIGRLLVMHGGVEGLLSTEPSRQKNNLVGTKAHLRAAPKAEPPDLKAVLAELHVNALNRAKAQGNPMLDALARVAVLKFLRSEMHIQFRQILERCRMLLKNYEGVRQQKGLEYRQCVSEFQITKKIIVRKTGQELLRTLREIETEKLARMRRSLFGNSSDDVYKLFVNPLVFTEDGYDAQLNAEEYVMLGNFERDPDRFPHVRSIASEFLRYASGETEADDSAVEPWLNVPENAQELVGGGTPDDSTEGRYQKARLSIWVEMLEREDLMDYVIASYEVAPLIAEYSPMIHPQQLKNALVLREERNRVEKLIKEHGKLSCDRFYVAQERVAVCRSSERARVAGRFLRDLMRYHRDLRRLEAFNAAADSINLIGNEKLRTLSAMNGSLYEFLLSDEQKPSEEKVLRHVVLKADVRDSSRLTRSLLERGLNPASYFSLNFYDPVNKLISKYGASKVFLEGDAIILAILERDGEASLAVSRACVLGREIIEIVRGYNELLERAGLPVLELGIGISYQDSPPMYLLDGEEHIMISDALNESDRLSSCSKRVRRSLQQLEPVFNVYEFQRGNDGELDLEDALLRYNLNGIRLSDAAFIRLRHEISLAPCPLEARPIWEGEQSALYTGLVTVGNEIFRKIVVREGNAAQIQATGFAPQQWTERRYYEVCTNSAIYSALEGKAAAGA